MNLQTIKAAILGFAVADALGLPVEFKSRRTLTNKPVVDMVRSSTWRQPAGSWSDDTSMTIATMESFARLKKIDYIDIMDNFVKWIHHKDFTANGRAFDVGLYTHRAIYNHIEGYPIFMCGLDDEHSNGNGSIMRILPIAFINYARCGNKFDDEAMDIIHEVSALTNSHPISFIACGIYCLIAAEMLDGQTIPNAINDGLKKADKYYKGISELDSEFRVYKRIFKDNFAETYVEDIKTSNYVVDTLEAAIWCLLNTNDYKSLVLKAVNLGGNTPTVSAIAAGLASINYGLEQIPKNWLDVLKKRDYLENICQNFYNGLVAVK